MDGIIVVALIVVIVFYFRRVDKIVTGVAIIDIFLRIFNYIITNIEINGISEHVEKYLPTSIPGVINIYTSGVISDILMWVYVVCMTIFLFYTIKRFFLKK